MPNSKDLTIDSLAGGLNDTSQPQELQPDECTQADNVEFFGATCGERRLGMAALSLTSSGLTSESDIVHLSQWFPTNVITLPEYIAVAATPGSSVSAARRDTAGTWHVLTPNDAINNAVPDIFSIVAQALSAKDFLAYHSGQDRLHLWDGTTFRRTGMGVPVAPTAANAGAGAFSGTRYYRVRYVELNGSIVVRRGEPGATLSFTPSGTGASITVTKPAAITEGETHWELEASLDNANFYRVARTVVATTTFSDTTAVAKHFSAASVAAPVSNDGSAITYIQLSDQAAQLNLTGTVSNGNYGNPAGTISGRGWIGYTAAGVYIPTPPATWSAANNNWWASPDVATAMEQASAGGTGQDYSTFPLSESIGAYLNIPSARFLAVDGDRLIYGSHWTDDTQKSQVGWTPVAGDPGVGNSERAPIVTTGGVAIATTQQLDPYDGGPLTGLAASTFGTWYAFKWQRIYSAVRTRDVTTAYDINTISSTRGAIPGSIVKATDANGSSIIFFLDPFVGPCRLGVGGVVQAIHGLRTTWKRVNTKATSLVCCGTYYPYKQQVKWWISVDGGNSPTLGITLQTDKLKAMSDGELRGGLSLVTGKAGSAKCAAALTFTVGNFTTDLPFIGLPTPDFVQQLDTGTDDNGTAFTGTIKSKPFFPAGLLDKWGVRGTGVLSTADSNGALSVSLIRDEGLETITKTAASLAPVASEPQVITVFDDLVLSELKSMQVKLSDGAAGKNWHAQTVTLRPRAEDTF